MAAAVGNGLVSSNGERIGMDRLSMTPARKGDAQHAG
jgi:hypothetical protein